MLVVKSWRRAGRCITIKRWKKSETFFEEIPRLLRASRKAHQILPELLPALETINQQIGKQVCPLLLKIATRRRRGNRETNFDVSYKGRIIVVD